MPSKNVKKTELTQCISSDTNLKDTAFGYTLSLINGKYKMIIMYWLYQYKPVMRFNELKRCIAGISFKTLSSTLKEMESDGLIVRNAYLQVPPKVEYSLSARGLSLKPILDSMCEWGVNNRQCM